MAFDGSVGTHRGQLGWCHGDRPFPGDTDLTASGDDLAARAVELAQRWITESAEVDVDPAAERLAGVLKDPNGLPFTIGFVDGVMRPRACRPRHPI